MGVKLTASFDDLLRSRYGASNGVDPQRFALNIDDLLAGYHGAPPKRRHGSAGTATSIVLSCRTDDGDAVPQRRGRRRDAGEYVAQQSTEPTPSSAAEYVAREVTTPSKTR